MGTVSMSSTQPTSKVLLASSSLNALKDRSDLSALNGKSKVDRVAEILLRVKSLTKKLDGKGRSSNDSNSNQSMNSATSGRSDLSLMIKGGKAMEKENKVEIDNKNQNQNENADEKLNSTWSLSNPMHSDRIEKERGAGAGVGRDRSRENNNLSGIEEEDNDNDIDMNNSKDKGKDRRIRPHRYGRSSDIIEEGEEDAEEEVEEEGENLISHYKDADHHGMNDVTVDNNNNNNDDDDDDDDDSDGRTKEYSETDRLMLRKR